MGEIKSTLDLVMERTSHLSMTPEEKARQREEDFKKRLQGLLQRYADEKLGLQELLKSIENLQAETGAKDDRQVLGMVCNRMDPDEDTQAWLALLASLAPQITGPIEGRLACYRTQKEQLMRSGAQQIRDRLTRDHAIHGSAVLPAPEQDEDCRQDLRALREKVLLEIEALCRQKG